MNEGAKGYCSKWFHVALLGAALEPMDNEEPTTKKCT